jgi:hypothetical protein
MRRAANISTLIWVACCGVVIWTIPMSELGYQSHWIYAMAGVAGLVGVPALLVMLACHLVMAWQDWRRGKRPLTKKKTAPIEAAVIDECHSQPGN